MAEGMERGTGQGMPSKRLPRARMESPLLALTVGMLGSGAANTAWTWEHGPVRVIAGLFATALVPVGMHLWTRVPVPPGWSWSRFLRAAAMTYICGAAAVVNLAHAVWLLTDHPSPPGEHPVLAFLLIAAIEAVMVMASLARRKPAEGASKVGPDEAGTKAEAVSLAPAPSQEPDTAWSGPEGVDLPALESAPPPACPASLTVPPCSEPALALEPLHVVPSVPGKGKATTEKTRVRALARELGVPQSEGGRLKSMTTLRADIAAAERALAERALAGQGKPA